MKKEHINVWKKIGLLENLSLSQAEKCAESLTKISKLLLNESTVQILNKLDKTLRKDYVVETIIPVTRKLYNYNLKKFPNENWLFKDYVKFLNKNKHKIETDNIINLYCENLVKKLQKEKLNKGEK